MCDDNKYFLDELERLTGELSREISSVLQFEIDRFSDGFDLMVKIRNGSRYDLIMLDWDMPIINGEATGQAIRLVDRDCLIVFITCFAEYALRATRLTTFRYILKDCLKKDLPEALQSAYDKQLFDKKMLTVKIAHNNLVYLRIKDIVHVEHRANETLISCKQAQYISPSRTFFREIEATLRGCGFVKPFKGILVNVREIKELQKIDLLMSNGKKIPLSRNYQKDVMVALHQQMVRYS